MKTKKLLVIMLVCVALFAFAFNASADVASDYNGWSGDCYYVNGVMQTNQWIPDEYDDLWYYVGADGARYTEGVYQIGSKLYAFDWSGIMYEGTQVYFYDYETETQAIYYAQGGAADGALLTNAWHQSLINDEYWPDDGWWYYGADGKAYTENVYKIGGVWYGFDSSGRMYDDQAFDFGYYDEELQDWVYTGSYRAKKGGELCTGWYQDKWEDDYGNINYGYWYYYMSDGKAAEGPVTIGGKLYVFEYGRMLENEIYSSGGVNYVVDENGVAYELPFHGWKQINGNWYLVLNGEVCRDDFYTTGGVTYYFYWDGTMADDNMVYFSYQDKDGFWVDEVYYALPGGAIAKNAWIEEWDSWYYFGADGKRYEDGLIKIGSYYYYFYEYGEAAQNEVIQIGGKVYAVGDNCRAVEVDGWFINPEYEEETWSYAKDGALLRNGIHNIGGKNYVFGYSGYLFSEGIYSIGDKEYLVNANGEVGTTKGWVTYNGNYYFVDSDNSLYEGWLNNGGNYYYMQPAMEYCDIIELEGTLYAINFKGQRQAITGTGFYVNLDDTTYYLKNGNVVKENWVSYGGEWYYFGFGGEMMRDCGTKIDGVWYYFNQDGTMANDGWGRDSSGTWFWAAGSGALFTGKDGAGYVFDEMGRLVENGTIEINGTWYVTNHIGKAVKTLTNGWNQVGSDWYLVVDGNPVYGNYTDSQGRTFLFNEGTGKMFANGIINNCYYNANGEMKTGWIWFDGKWYYGDKSEYNYGYLYNDGIYDIDGKQYYFNNNILQTNVTVPWEGEMITTNADGAIIKRTPMNGWSYRIDGYAYDDYAYAYGEVYYYKNGEAYNGWLGDYYISYGRLCTDTVILWNNKHYYLKSNGLCAYNGWVNTSYYGDSWIYAKADGSVYYDEWLQLGSKWYYFDEAWMACAGIYEIDGELHKFDANGVWLGEVADSSSSNYKDGWQEIGGKWYFYMAGEPVEDRELYISGKWYRFDYKGILVTNTFAYNYEYMADCVYYSYYGSDGARINYTGWKKINNQWVWFNKDGYAPDGLFFDGSNYYHQDMKYFMDKYTEKVTPSVAMTTGYMVYNGNLFYFNGSGILAKTITTDGWHQLDGDWFYVENGKAAYGEQKKIGNTYYAFYSDGRMAENDIFNGYYYGSDGKRVTKAQWIKTNYDGRWIYVLDGGIIVENGIVLIGGKEYVFSSGYWVG